MWARCVGGCNVNSMTTRLDSRRRPPVRASAYFRAIKICASNNTTLISLYFLLVLLIFMSFFSLVVPIYFFLCLFFLLYPLFLGLFLIYSCPSLVRLVFCLSTYCTFFLLLSFFLIIKVLFFSFNYATFFSFFCFIFHVISSFLPIIDLCFRVSFVPPILSLKT